jgi:hypothetical protein
MCACRFKARESILGWVAPGAAVDVNEPYWVEGGCGFKVLGGLQEPEIECLEAALG